MQIISLDLSVKGIIPLLQAKQGDVGRKFQAVITDGGTAYNIPSGTTLSMWYSGTSGEGNYNQIGLDDDFLRSRNAFTISGNTVTVELVAQMLSCPGGGTMCMVMNSAEGEQIATWNIPYIVEKVPGANSEGATQYYTAYAQAAMREMSSALAAALEDAKQSGEFDGPRGIQGEKGDTPVKGVDYWTDADKREIVDDVLDAIPDAGGSGALRYCADCHAVTEGGSYYIDANTLNRPDDVSAGTLFVERVPKSSGIDINLTLNDSGTILRCAYSSSAGTWDEWEWENPPYKFNKVYRTMERYNSLPVYAIKVPTGGFAYGMTSFSFNKGFTDDPNYVPAGWNVIAFDNVIFHDAVYGYNAADVIADYSASKYVESISAVFAETGLKIDIALKTTNLGGESTMNFVVKFVKADIV